MLDTKLQHLVKKIVNASENPAEPNIDVIVTQLRSEHREYLRKNLTKLRTQVEVVVDSLANTRKRKAEEDEYDEEAALYDAERAVVNEGGGLNESLQANYRKVQEKQQLQEKKLRRKLKRRQASQGDTTDSDQPAFLTPVSRPTVRYQDLGGLDAIIVQVRQLVEYPLLRPELYRHLGVDPPRGVLLRGPPGTGKVRLVCVAVERYHYTVVLTF